MDQRLKDDTLFIKSLKLSELLLMKDGDLDWFILVPRKEGVIEFIDLNDNDQNELFKEIAYVSNILKKHSTFEKINIGMLGNVVRDLHVHIVARKKNDRAFPGPIWGTKANKEFDSSRQTFWVEKFKEEG